LNTEVTFEDGALIVTRVYDASRESVFDAWIESSKVVQWWGCAECTSVRSEIEPKVGGKYNHQMTIGDAGETEGVATLTEYDPSVRLAFTSASPGDADAYMVVTVDFSEVENGTQVRLVHTGIPDMKVPGDIELREIIRDGWTAAFEKLGRFLVAPSQV
jgi:uncharacterized protein YndB with AHSA1/START domain